MYTLQTAPSFSFYSMCCTFGEPKCHIIRVGWMLISANPSRPHTKPEHITQFSDNNIAQIATAKTNTNPSNETENNKRRCHTKTINNTKVTRIRRSSDTLTNDLWSQASDDKVQFESGTRVLWIPYIKWASVDSLYFAAQLRHQIFKVNTTNINIYTYIYIE